MNGKSSFRWLAVLVAIVVSVGTAQAIDPREVAGAPEGTTDYFQLLGVQSRGENFWVNGKKVSSNAPFRAHAESLRYGHIWSAGSNKSFLVSGIFTYYGDVTVGGPPVANKKTSFSGPGDATALFAFWPLADWIKKEWFVTAVWVSAPTGDYDNRRLVNIGRNAWTIRPEFGWAKAWGPFFLQLVGDITLETDNTDYGPASRTLKRDPRFDGEVHSSFNLTPRFWIGASWYGAAGFQSTVKETRVKNNDKQRDQTIGLSMSYTLPKKFSVLASTKIKAVTNNGFDQAELFRLKLTYAF